MNDEQITVVVRRLGSGKHHVATVPPANIMRASVFGAPFTGVTAPTAAACRAVLRDPARLVVVMQPGTAVNCSTCTRLTGITHQTDDMYAKAEADA